MDIDGLLDFSKTSGWGCWNGEAIGSLLLAWDFLLSEQQKEEVAAFFNVSPTRMAVAEAAHKYMDEGCRQGRWRWEPSD